MLSRGKQLLALRAIFNQYNSSITKIKLMSSRNLIFKNKEPPRSSTGGGAY